mgnify:CR=1 FL=1
MIPNIYEYNDSSGSLNFLQLLDIDLVVAIKNSFVWIQSLASLAIFNWDRAILYNEIAKHD